MPNMDSAQTGFAHAHHGHVEVIMGTQRLWQSVWAANCSAAGNIHMLKVVRRHPAQNEAMMNLIRHAQVHVFENDVLCSQIT